jgi:hypothetical protein
MRILIFGTTYVDTPAKQKLARQWRDLHRRINKPIELMLVDSASPMLPELHNVDIHRLPDNIGHLSRGGRDGWGRAFCFGLEYAIEHGYDYVCHVEGDSLCRINFKTICARMMMRGIVARAPHVMGTRKSEPGWLETGLMVFDVRFLKEIDLVGRYDWEDGKSKKYPNTPERMLGGLLNGFVEITPWRSQRDDVGQLTVNNVWGYDWISHTKPEIYDAYFQHYMETAAEKANA